MSLRSLAVAAGVPDDHPDLAHLDTVDPVALAKSGHPVLQQIGQWLLGVAQQLGPILIPVLLGAITGRPVTPIPTPAPTPAA